MDYMVDRRELERQSYEYNCSYIVNHGKQDEEYPCTLEEVTEKGLSIIADEEQGFKAGPKGGVKPGMTIRINLKGVKITCRVAYVDTGRVGVYFQSLTDEQREALKKIAA